MLETTQPRGRDSVRAALLEAAEVLFSDRGPAAVSVRDIAREAGVNHGLVHRHFGSKAGLLHELMTLLSVEIADAIGPADESESLLSILARALGSTTARGSHWRILAHCLLEGADPTEIQADFPVVRRMLAAARRGSSENLGPDALVTLVVCTALGMIMFKPYLKQATGQSDAQWDQTRSEISGLMAKLAAASDSTGS